MTTSVNENLIITAARSDATGYVDLGNEAARRLDAAFVKNVPAMSEATYRGYADALRSTVADLEERMTMGTTIEIESAIRTVLQRIDAINDFLSAKPTKVTSQRIVDDRRLDPN
ncbi:MAG: hypothetical protein JWN04_4202 [Myxococcaceae bacterium]|nr:hypothetical protein [Myxococcaceae bacterium]